MIKYLKSQTLTYLIGSNPINNNNYHAISLCKFMYTVVINYINISLIAIKTRGQDTDQKLIAVNEMLYFIRVLLDMLHIIYAQHNVWWDNTIIINYNIEKYIGAVEVVKAYTYTVVPNTNFEMI